MPQTYTVASALWLVCPSYPYALVLCSLTLTLLCPCPIYLLLYQPGELGKVVPREKLLPTPTARALVDTRGSC